MTIDSFVPWHRNLSLKAKMDPICGIRTSLDKVTAMNEVHKNSFKPGSLLAALRLGPYLHSPRSRAESRKLDPCDSCQFSSLPL